jgi:uncharacterized protein
MPHYISKYQAQTILIAHEKGRHTAHTSLDLGITEAEIAIDAEKIAFPDGQKIETRILQEIAKDDACYMLDANQAYRMQFHLPETGRTYKLLSTGPRNPPTAELSGFRMHRTKDTDPAGDTKAKISAIKPVHGTVLDTCTGLGYTAIAALKAGAEEVHTVEVDEGMIKLREHNPWSAGLADDRIKKNKGDVCEWIREIEDETYNAILHDPPTAHIAGNLYSLEFYSQMHRTLKENGKLYHYIGAPGRRRGKNPSGGAVKRLREAGFKEVAEKPRIQGITAKKGYSHNPDTTLP